MPDVFHRMRLVSDSVEVNGLPRWIVGGRASPKSQRDGHQFVCFLSFCSTESFSSRQFTAAPHLGGGYFLERGQEQSEHDSLSHSVIPAEPLLWPPSSKRPSSPPALPGPSPTLASGCRPPRQTWRCHLAWPDTPPTRTPVTPNTPGSSHHSHHVTSGPRRGCWGEGGGAPAPTWRPVKHADVSVSLGQRENKRKDLHRTRQISWRGEEGGVGWGRGRGMRGGLQRSLRRK